MSKSSKSAENQQDKKNYDIPKGVVDKAAYLTYIRLKRQPALNLPDRLIHTSDEDTVIDPFAVLMHVVKKIEHLPDQEQDEIVKKCRAITVLKTKMMREKKFAYGITGGKTRNPHPSLSDDLLEERATEVIGYFGELSTEAEIAQRLQDKFGLDISTHLLRKFKKKHQGKIDAVKEEFIQDYSDIRLSHKKGRLIELQKLFLDRKQKYDGTQAREDYKLLLATLKEIRSETHDNTLRIDANINSNINVTIQSHIEHEIMGGLTINDIVIARAAAKMQVNPAFIIARLHNSLYGKHSGFARPDDGQQQVEYPSSMVYNWDEIAKQHKVGDVDAELTEYEEVPDRKAKHVKEALLAAIKAKRTQGK